jgi:hypothetical protein
MIRDFDKKKSATTFLIGSPNIDFSISDFSLVKYEEQG